jgi:osmotically-inducible protein OsmY
MSHALENKFGGESEYSRDQSNPYEMADYLFDKKLDYRGVTPKGFELKDDWILKNVCEVLLRDPHIDATEIEVELRSGVVLLTGRVDSRRTKKLAELNIQGIPGVKDVMNFLTFLPLP